MTEPRQNTFDALLVSFQGSRALVRQDNGEEVQCKMRQAARDTVSGDRVVVQIAGDEPVIESRLARSSDFFRTDMRGRKKNDCRQSRLFGDCGGRRARAASWPD